ncbi:ATP-binding protein [Spirosoma gilvum]
MVKKSDNLSCTGKIEPVMGLVVRVCCLYLVVVGLAHGQSQIQQLKNQLTTATTDTARSRIYFELGSQYPDVAVDSSLFFLNQSLHLAKEAHSSFLIAQALWKLGFIYMYYPKDDDRAINLFSQSIAIAKIHKDKINLARCYTYLAMVAYHQRTGNWNELLDKAKGFAGATNDWQVLSEVYAMTSNIYSYEGQPQKAIKTIYKAMLISRPSFDHWFSYSLDYAEMLAEIGRRNEAKAVYRELSTVKNQLGFAQSDFVHYNDLARLEIGLKNYKQAEQLLLRMVAMEKERAKPDSFHLFIMQRSLRQLYIEQQDYKKAFLAADKLADLRVWKSNKEQTIDSRLKMTQLRAALDLEKKEREIAQLTAQEQRNRSYLVGAIVIAVMLVSFVLILQRAKRRIEHQSTELRELNSMKDKLFAILSHDLHSPVASLKNLLSLTTWGALSQLEFAESIQILNRQVSGLLTMLDNLLNWSMSQMGGIQQRLNPINLYLIIDEQLALLRPIAETKGVTLLNNLPAEIPLLADANQLGVVFRNLLQNALKFTHPGGQIDVNGSLDSDWCTIRVTDSGIGMPQSIQDQLFRKGTSTSQPGTMGEKGTGIGLTIVNELIQANRGQIRFESEEGVGTTFIILFPRAIPQRRPESCEQVFG